MALLCSHPSFGFLYLFSSILKHLTVQIHAPAAGQVLDDALAIPVAFLLQCLENYLLFFVYFPELEEIVSFRRSNHLENDGFELNY